MFDFILKDGIVVDGSGNPWTRTDIGIREGRISKVGRLEPSETTKLIDVKDLIVSPGFIDIHSHSDFTLLVDPKAESKTKQGVTTEIVGNCGTSAGPMTGKTLQIDALRTYGFKFDSLADYFRHLEKQGISVNLGSLAGHSTIRTSVMGVENRPPTAPELQEMKNLVAQSMEEGALGFSSVLVHAPGAYADKRELAELCRVVAERGGIYATHVRGEGTTIESAVSEAIEIGEETGIPVEIAHHKAIFQANWGKVRRTLLMMEDARRRGIDVACDVYPYTAAMGLLKSYLPPWANEGGIRELTKRLSEDETRRKIIEDMKKDTRTQGGAPLDELLGSTMISQSKHFPSYEGQMLPDIAKSESITPLELAFRLIEKDEGTTASISFRLSEEDVQTVLKHPLSTIGTDGFAQSPHGILGKGKSHPRSYGCFPRVLARYVRDLALLPLEEAIRKMTSAPARMLRLRDRGYIREGMWADITVFDREKIQDKATYEDPHKYPEGIHYVFVNGALTVRNGEHTGELAGKTLRLENRD